jgi:hypothetical protein
MSTQHLSTRHLSASGIVAALFALMVQIALGAIVPPPDPMAAVASAEVLCHTGGPSDDGSGSVPPLHALDCLACPLCAALHAPAPVLGSAPVVPLPAQAGFRLASVPAPVAAPSRADYPPLQARAPPLA